MQVRFSDRAAADMEEIWGFVAEGSERSASKLMLEIRSAVERVVPFPDSKPLAHRVARPRVRRINVRTWAVFYESDGDCIVVVRVVHAGRNLPRLQM